MKKTGYQIQNVSDRMNVIIEDQEQTFDTLEEARSWADCVADDINEYNATVDENKQLKKEDFIVAYYKDGVQRGDFPLFEA